MPFIRGEWDKEWNNYKEGKHSKEFLLGNDKNRAKKLLEMNRWDLSRYVGLITGHGNLSYFTSKIEEDINPLCRFCYERNETFIHLTECPRLREYQNDSFLGEDRPWKWDHKQIMKFSFCRAVNEAIEGLEGGEYSIFSTSTDSNDSTDSKDTFRYSQPEPD